MTGQAEHRLRIWQVRTGLDGVVDPDGELRLQWESTCVCGWRCLTYSWDDPWRGVLPVSLKHLRDPGPVP